VFGRERSGGKTNYTLEPVEENCGSQIFGGERRKRGKAKKPRRLPMQRGGAGTEKRPIQRERVTQHPWAVNPILGIYEEDEKRFCVR
jgi:hypothetical protein